MTRHAYPTLPDDRTSETVQPTDQSDLGEWEVAAERDLVSDEPALAEADHQILADDDLDDDDDDVEDLDDEDDADPEDDEEEKEDGADDEDDEDDFDEDEEDEEDAEEDEEVDEK